MTEYEYIKELYGLAIDDKNIWCKYFNRKPI